MWQDNHGRIINYLRLAITDRCNLRCFYCMPAQGLEWLPRKDLMSYEEMLRLCTLLASKGVDKVRITGGEPFVRKDLMHFLTELVAIKNMRQVSITTNGVLAAPYISQLKALGISSVNLSLDTLDPNRFFAITRRDAFEAVWETLQQLLLYKMDIKINAVVMEGKNIEDILPLVQLTKDLPVSVRFIEEMPFNGEGHAHSGIYWNYKKIVDTIQAFYPTLHKIPDPLFSTSSNYQIPGHRGNVGVIAAYTRSFCGTCNRIRVTPQGELKTCLYGDSVLNIKDLMREGKSNPEIEKALRSSLRSRAVDGWEAAGNSLRADAHQSMATIGG